MTAKDYVIEVVRDRWMDADEDEEYQPTLATLGEKLRRGKQKKSAETTATDAP